jgi:tryptophan-rich sensory protein
VDLNTIFYETHSGTRWLVVLATLVAIGWMLYGLVTNRDYGETERRVMLVFSSLLGLQWFIGIGLLVWLGSQIGSFSNRLWWEHTFIMTLALAVAHVHLMIKKRPDRQRYIGGLLSVIVVLAFVYIGVARVGGWAI